MRTEGLQGFSVSAGDFSNILLTILTVFFPAANHEFESTSSKTLQTRREDQANSVTRATSPAQHKSTNASTFDWMAYAARKAGSELWNYVVNATGGIAKTGRYLQATIRYQNRIFYEDYRQRHLPEVASSLPSISSPSSSNTGLLDYDNEPYEIAALAQIPLHDIPWSALKLQGPTQKITKLDLVIWHPMDSLQRLRAASSDMVLAPLKESVGQIAAFGYEQGKKFGAGIWYSLRDWLHARLALCWEGIISAVARAVFFCKAVLTAFFLAHARLPHPIKPIAAILLVIYCIWHSIA